ncbi:MAG: BBE domain-containing protein [Cyanobacteria bacterium P01_G01_bin.54]
MSQANYSEPNASLPTAVSDRQGFNKRWYASDANLQIVRPTSAQEVLAVFSAILADPNIAPGQCQITCGRHCYEGFVYNANTRAILDLTGLKAYGEAIVNGEPTLYVDVGLGNWDMYRLLNNVYQKTLPAGSCYSVGLGGHITGGGYGVLSRLYGLSIDYLTAVDIVVGDRRQGARLIRQCSATHEPELFWAVRGGGGGQFGIITRYYFGLNTLPNAPTYIYIHALGWDWQQGGSTLSETTFSAILDYFQDTYARQEKSTWNTFGIFAGNHRDAGTLNLSAIHTYDAAYPLALAEFERDLFATIRQRQDQAAAIAPLSTADLVFNSHPYIASTRRLGLTATNTWRKYTYLEGMQQLNTSGPNRYGKYKSAYHTEKFNPAMTAAAYQGLTTTVTDAQGNRVDMSNSLIQFDSYGGKINTIAAEATAIPQRNSILKLQYQSYWDTNLPPGQDDPVLETAHVNWLNGMYQEIYAASGGIPNGVGTEGCYFNYPDIDIGSTGVRTPPLEQALTLYFGENLPRLQQVSAQYNPDGWFQNSQSLSNLV